MIHDHTHFKRGIDWKQIIINLFGAGVFIGFLASLYAVLVVLSVLMGG